MEPTLPRRTVAYDGKLTRSARWDRFRPRADDIFICTPPKSGTTWMQAICALLIFGRPDIGHNPANLSPWLDAEFEPIDDLCARLDAQQHRRSIKTHTPLDGIPYFPDCTYLAVYRDPRDVYFSMRSHADNMRYPVFGDLFGGEVGPGFRRWVDTEWLPGDADTFSLSGIAHHYRSFRAFADRPNLHFFHYDEMLRDLSGTMAAVARVLGIAIDAATMAALVRAAGFDNMQANAERFAPNAGTGRWKDERRFFNRGGSGQWQGLLTDEDLALYDTRLRTLLPEAEIAWLQHGNISA